jgi:hypothetical protein
MGHQLLGPAMRPKPIAQSVPGDVVAVTANSVPNGDPGCPCKETMYREPVRNPNRPGSCGSEYERAVRRNSKQGTVRCRAELPGEIGSLSEFGDRRGA